MDRTCGGCGNVLCLKQGLERLRSYRGEPNYQIPEDLVIPTCLKCGAEWLTDLQIDLLSQDLERQWRERHPTLGQLSDDPQLPDITEGDIKL